MKARPLVLGVGTAFRGDDEVGWLVVDGLLGEGIDVERSDGEPARLVESWRDRGVVVVVDALRSTGRPPGTVVVLAPHQIPVAAHGASHGGGVAPALALGRALGRLPAEVWVVGVVGEHFAPGDACSAAVRTAIEPARHAVGQLVVGHLVSTRADSGETVGGADASARPSDAGSTAGGLHDQTTLG